MMISTEYKSMHTHTLHTKSLQTTVNRNYIYHVHIKDSDIYWRMLNAHKICYLLMIALISQTLLSADDSIDALLSTDDITDFTNFAI